MGHIGEHEHTHPHDHEHEHHHEHTQCSGHCADCEACDSTPIEEFKALINYMIDHNMAHTKEMISLAESLRNSGHQDAFEQVTVAAADFERGNLRISQVLAALNQAEE